MAKKLSNIIDAIRTKDYAYATEGIGRILEVKVQNALDREKRAVGANLVKEEVKKYDVPFKTKDGKTVNRKVTVPPSNNEDVEKPAPKPLPKHARNPYRNKNGEPICQNCEKPGSQCDCEPRGSFNEETVAQYEVQRIYDEIGDIGETELLCGITNLRVNPQGQVISYICEAAGWEDPNVMCPKCKHPAVEHYYYGCDHKGCDCTRTERDFDVPRKVTESWSDPEIADASDLGFKPGEWPKVFTTPDGTWHFDKFIKHGSEIEAALYRGIELGKSVFLKVYND